NAAASSQNEQPRTRRPSMGVTRRAWLRGCALLLLGGMLAAPGMASDAPPPTLQLELKPHATDGAFDYVDGRMTIESPNVAAGETLVKMPLVVVSIPTARYDGDALRARDEAGELPLTIKDEPP